MIDLKSTTLPGARCPSCLYKMDRATHSRNQDVKPEPGDYSVCINCGAVLRFTIGYGLELAPPLEELHPETRAQLERARMVVRNIHRAKRSP